MLSLQAEEETLSECFDIVHTELVILTNMGCQVSYDSGEQLIDSQLTSLATEANYNFSIKRHSISNIF